MSRISHTPASIDSVDLRKQSLGAAQRVLERCDLLAACSDHPTQLTRTFCSPAMAAAHGLFRGWMTEAGMTTRLDAIGNLIGSYPTSANIKSPERVLLIGSHLDTVINAGRYDGPLGVLLGLATVDLIRESGFALPFLLDVIGFCEEEGIRYRTPFIGSKWLTGCLESELFDRVDERGVTMRSALEEFSGTSVGSETQYDGDQVIAFVEPHIEQGPLLEREVLPVGIVDTIAGQTRATVRITGEAGHAGTVPMSLRRDALAGAAEWIARIESLARNVPGAVATVGRIEVTPNVANVIPSEARLSLDVRHADDEAGKKMVDDLLCEGEEIVGRRGLLFSVASQEQFPAVAMDRELSGLLATCVVESGFKIRRMMSGAGHDAGVMARKFPTAMLFVRCREGISHHPDESVRVEDVAVALEVLVRVIYKLAVAQNP